MTTLFAGESEPVRPVIDEVRSAHLELLRHELERCLDALVAARAEKVGPLLAEFDENWRAFNDELAAPALEAEETIH